MKKRIISSLLTLGLCVSLVACGSSSDGEKQTEGTQEAVTESKNTEEVMQQDGMDVLEGITVGFSQCDSANSWRIAETESIENAAEKYGAKLVYTDASGDIAKQASDIEDMVAQGVEYIVVAPLEEDGLQAALKSAMEAGSKVILVDRSVNGEAGELYTTNIMSDFVWEAEQCGEVLVEALGGSGNVVTIQGNQGATVTRDRQEGFVKAVEGKLNIVSDQVANYAQDEAQEVMENVLQAQGDEIDAVFCHNDDMAQGAIAAIKAAGYEPGKDILVAGVDGSKAAMESVIAGEQLVSVSCTPDFGEPVFSVIAKLVNGEEVETSYKNEDTVYTKENATVEAGF